MAITTLTELKTAIDNWTGRADLTARSPEFIALAEAKMQRELRARDMETKISAISIDGEYVPLPADFLEVRYFELGTTPRTVLRFMPLETQTELYGITGTTTSYCIVGNNFRFGPTPNVAYSSTLVYFAKFPPLGTTQASNWVLANHPDIYLFGALTYAAAWAQDEGLLKVAIAGYDDALTKIKSQGDRGRWGGTGLATRAERVA